MLYPAELRAHDRNLPHDTIGIIENNQETEIKLAVHSVRYANTLLASAGFAVRTPRHHEFNLILDRAAQPLRQQGELLRLREAGGQTVLTYKGQAQAGIHKTREEIEITAGSFDQALLLFERIGFRPIFRYEKFRTVFQRLGDPGVVTLDETPIGEFLEVEGPPSWIDSVARKLGFEPAQYITESYGRLYLNWLHAHGKAPGDMLFRAHPGSGELEKRD
jgi:adenylate cyclase class 2